MSNDTEDPAKGPASGGETEETRPARRARPCPNCSKLSVDKFYPFCSKRCADVDLHRWLNAAYSVPVVELDDIDPSQFEE
ncbi:DNA gyrase inhibitor YacG [Breoghania sp. L-A4]|uniref:DNA gyrase inhibitor YacG n=1 Tax=Breoghania sp. L-A4 TaxID=2304600 RepID=UPI000E358EB8|nr:DNA gyrase inhibitor YacG [Breoghania sp. L-A4]AXS42476.1 DNA gyrase inhibitor YacG [Breoghania sp. L-A4]